MNSQGLLARRPPMPTPIAPRIRLAQNARANLQALARAHSTPQTLALRARIILRAGEPENPSNLKIAHDLGCSNLTVGKWRRRYHALGPRCPSSRAPQNHRLAYSGAGDLGGKYLTP